MVSLWGSKKDDDPEDTSVRPQHGESSEHAEPRTFEANERTRLLPPPSQGYLSPSDPAVSTSSLVLRMQNNSSHYSAVHDCDEMER